jgi:hypothetical protein
MYRHRRSCRLIFRLRPSAHPRLIHIPQVLPGPNRRLPLTHLRLNRPTPKGPSRAEQCPFRPPRNPRPNPLLTGALDPARKQGLHRNPLHPTVCTLSRRRQDRRQRSHPPATRRARAPDWQRRRCPCPCTCPGRPLMAAPPRQPSPPSTCPGRPLIAAPPRQPSPPSTPPPPPTVPVPSRRTRLCPLSLHRSLAHGSHDWTLRRRRPHRCR